MIENTDKFTRPQLERIYEILSHINEANESERNYKYEALKCYVDSDNNFYVSYYRHGHNHDGPVSEVSYFKIDRLGIQHNEKERFSTNFGVAKYFDTLKECDLTEEIK